MKFVCHKAQGTLRPVGVVGEEALAMVPDGGMRLNNKERLYDPEENPSSDVRYVTVKQYAKEHVEKVLDGGPRIGCGPIGKIEAKPYQTGTPAAAPADKGASPLETLKITIARVNQLAANIGNVHLAIADGKLRASVVTTIDL